MSSTFTPSDLIDISKEKEWAANIGMLDWDSTSIVFTKRSLIEFLKYAGITVDTNFNNISKLPRFAKFGKLVDIPVSHDAVPTSQHQASVGSIDARPSSGAQPTSGSQIHNILGHDEGADALSMAPPKPDDFHQESSSAHADMPQTEASLEEAGASTNPKPSRRVRTQPGGHSSLSNFWGTDEPVEEYKPSRRVRERPGGQDHINNIL